MPRRIHREQGRRVVGSAVAFAALWAAQASPAEAQGTKADYERALNLEKNTRDLVFKTRVDPHWYGDDEGFWYRNELGGGASEYVEVVPEKRTRTRAFDHSKLAARLAKAVDAPVLEDRLPIDRWTVAESGVFLFRAFDRNWKYVVRDDSLAECASFPESSPRPTPSKKNLENRRSETRAIESPSPKSPDGRFEATIRDRNVFIKSLKDGEERRITYEGTESDGYVDRFHWSPDSRLLMVPRRVSGDARKVVEVESSPKDRLQPKVHEWEYLKPGDRVPYEKPHLFRVSDGAEIPIRDDLFSNPWSVDEYRWAKDSSKFTFIYNQRGHRILRLISVDAKTGEAEATIEEKSDTFIDYAHKGFRRYLDQTDEVIWMTERDGWNHLLRIDLNSGAIKARLTKGEWVVRQVDRVDEESRRIFFRACGIRPGQDPYQIHFARVDFDGSNLVVLTEGDGTHEAVESPGGRYILDTYSRPDLAPVAELRRAEDGGLAVALERADWSKLLETGWKVPERFVAKGRDGKTDIFGLIFRPTTFDPKKSYPVIEQIYAGPQGAYVPKRFAAFHRPQALAELGFIVVQIDGMGTNWRSKAFHDVCSKNLADAGFPDRILWLKAAARTHPEMDLSRVGIYGGSAGGQNALGALLFHGDFYKAAAADCGCHDNRMDKIWWNELWMGWPVGAHYAEQSNAVQAHRLKGKLLLTVGELDRNVDPASTMQVVNALIAADKDFELIVFPGRGHGAGESDYGRRRRWDFFVKNLWNVPPRSP